MTYTPPPILRPDPAPEAHGRKVTIVPGGYWIRAALVDVRTGKPTGLYVMCWHKANGKLVRCHR